MRASTIAVIGMLSIGLVGSTLGQEAPAGPKKKPKVQGALREVPAAGTVAQAAPAATRPAAAATKFPYEGVVTGTNVNVRSGNGTNYYPVTRVHAGRRVTVLGEEYGWLKIEPPAGCYSLVDVGFVDTGDNKTGTVNADDVRVRAGSELSSKKYAVQDAAQLSRGAKVTILGEDKEAGFYKIVPPKGALLWIHKDFVRSAAGGPAPAVRKRPNANAAAKVVTTRAVARKGPPARGRASVPKHAALRQLPPSPGRDELDRIEGDLAKERTKPIDLRDLSPMADRLEQVAQTAQDRIAKIYAGQRAKQLRSWMALVGDLKTVRKTSDEVMVNRKPWRVSARPAPLEEQFDVEGELRVSQVFDSKALPRRYRLVDPTKRPARTVAYLELPPESQVDIGRYVGEYVRVRAADRTQLATAGRTIAAVVPAEIDVYTSNDEAKGKGAGAAAGPSVTEVSKTTKKSGGNE